MRTLGPLRIVALLLALAACAPRDCRAAGDPARAGGARARPAALDGHADLAARSLRWTAQPISGSQASGCPAPGTGRCGRTASGAGASAALFGCRLTGFEAGRPCPLTDLFSRSAPRSGALRSWSGRPGRLLLLLPWPRSAGLRTPSRVAATALKPAAAPPAARRAQARAAASAAAPGGTRRVALRPARPRAKPNRAPPAEPYAEPGTVLASASPSSFVAEHPRPGWTRGICADIWPLRRRRVTRRVPFGPSPVARRNLILPIVAGRLGFPEVRVRPRLALGHLRRHLRRVVFEPRLGRGTPCPRPGFGLRRRRRHRHLEGVGGPGPGERQLRHARCPPPRLGEADPRPERGRSRRGRSKPGRTPEPAAPARRPAVGRQLGLWCGRRLRGCRVSRPVSRRVGGAVFGRDRLFQQRREAPPPAALGPPGPVWQPEPDWMARPAGWVPGWPARGRSLGRFDLHRGYRMPRGRTRRPAWLSLPALDEAPVRPRRLRPNSGAAAGIGGHQRHARCRGVADPRAERQRRHHACARHRPDAASTARDPRSRGGRKRPRHQRRAAQSAAAAANRAGSASSRLDLHGRRQRSRRSEKWQWRGPRVPALGRHRTPRPALRSDAPGARQNRARRAVPRAPHRR